MTVTRALFMVVSLWLACLAVNSQVPAKSPAPAEAKPAKTATLTSDQKTPLLEMLVHEAQLRLEIVAQQQALDDLRKQLNQAGASWQVAEMAALKTAGIDPETHEIKIDPAGHLYVAEKPAPPKTPVGEKSDAKK
jgi:hypothetical protein